MFLSYMKNISRLSVLRQLSHPAQALPYFFILSFCLGILNPLSECHASESKSCVEVLEGQVATLTAGKVIIVDGYSSGSLLAPEIKRRGYEAVHVHSRMKIPSVFIPSYKPGNFIDDIWAHLLSFEELVDRLDAYHPVAVIAGAESGVMLANRLSVALAERRAPQGRAFVSNGFDEASVDKYLMAQRVKSAGLDHTKKEKFTEIEAALSWVRQENVFGPLGMVVVKPPRSAGGDGVFFCQTEEQVREAVQTIQNRKTVYGDDSQQFLIEEFLPGTEYVVNTVSRDGVHHITDIWKYNKQVLPNGEGTLYLFDELMPFSGEIQEQISQYTKGVLKSLGINNGWGHAEIMYVPGRGPVLVEIGNRMMGSSQALLTAAALGQSQVNRGVDAYLDAERFHSNEDGYVIQRHAVLMSLNCPEKGLKLRPDIEQILRATPGYFRHVLFSRPGTELVKTVDMATQFGQIEILGDSKEDLMRTIASIQESIRSGRFFIK